MFHWLLEAYFPRPVSLYRSLRFSARRWPMPCCRRWTKWMNRSMEDSRLETRQKILTPVSHARSPSIARHYMLNMDHDDDCVPMRQMLLHGLRMLNMLQWNVDHDNQCNNGDNRWMSVETTRRHPIWAARVAKERKRKDDFNDGVRSAFGSLLPIQVKNHRRKQKEPITLINGDKPRSD